MVLFLAPNYLIAFLISAGLLIRTKLGHAKFKLAERTKCLGLLAVHLFGFAWALALSHYS